MPTDDQQHHRMQFQLGLRRRGISDQAVLKAMDAVPREMFVETGYLEDAYADTALPIACGQTISQPFVVAYMSEKLELTKDHRVLEIGTGSGYQAAVLGHLAGEVVSFERFPALANRARQRLSDLGLNNVEVRTADGLDLPGNLGSFDRIIATAAVETIPPALQDHLRPEGILIAPVGPPNDVQMLVKVRATAAGVVQEDLIPVRFVPALAGVARSQPGEG